MRFERKVSRRCRRRIAALLCVSVGAASCGKGTESKQRKQPIGVRAKAPSDGGVTKAGSSQFAAVTSSTERVLAVSARLEDGSLVTLTQDQRIDRSTRSIVR